MADSSEDGNESSSSIRGGEFIDQMSNYQPLKDFPQGVSS
jgi:hypothetical protein